MTDRYDELRAAAEAASNGNLDTAERVMVGEIQCPLCGDGVIDHKTWTNIDDKPVGIEVFGLGEALTNYEAFVRLANPETIKALLAERDSLLAALKPFADYLAKDDRQERWSDQSEIEEGVSITYGDLRRAAALTTKEG